MKTAKDKSTMMSMMGPVREELWSNDLKEYNTNNNKAVKLFFFLLHIATAPFSAFSSNAPPPATFTLALLFARFEETFVVSSLEAINKC